MFKDYKDRITAEHKQRVDSGNIVPQQFCTLQVKVMQAEESPDVLVVEFYKKMGSSLLFYSELAEYRKLFAAAWFPRLISF